MLKSSSSLREQLLLRRATESARVAALGREPSLDTEPFDFYLHERAIERIAELEAELGILMSDEAFEFEFDGRGVYLHSITFRRLEGLVKPIGQTLRWTARDQAILDGWEGSNEELLMLAEPVLSGTVQSSFGIRITRAPLHEQIAMDHGLLFDRAVDRVMALFRAAHDTNEPAAIVETLSGLRANAVNGFKELALALAQSTVPTRVRWRNEEVIAVSPSTAAVIVEALSNVRVTEENVVVVGVLTGGDLTDERFHLILDEEQAKPRDYKGNVEPNLIETLRSLTLGSRVQATIQVSETESDFLSHPKRSYLLTDIRILGGTH